MKLLCLSVLSFLFTVTHAQSTEETAIRQVLEKESATWRSGDVKGHADCWIIRPYSRILVSTGDSNVYDVPPQMMIHPPEGSMGKGGSSVNSNYKMNIAGAQAWVTHDEESTAADGSKTYSYEMRILEKVDGQWKLVGQSIHIYRRTRP